MRRRSARPDQQVDDEELLVQSHEVDVLVQIPMSATADVAAAPNRGSNVIVMDLSLLTSGSLAP
ncbi:MAG: hypothetical protein KatS3mg119_0451 [Rhodothalassiaceae bacterium]|nr:MAG: hypothetical protein KatS3mg119_0451 [Rhodothalassiaceae bacterium]